MIFSSTPEHPTMVLTALALFGGALLSQPASAAMITVETEATVRSGSNATVDQDEATAGYVHVKYDGALGSARKAYFQFDLTGENADLSAGASFTFSLQDDRPQAIKVWALGQAYPSFAATETWDTVQANDTASNDLLTAGAFTATQLGAVIGVPGATVGEQVQVNVPLLSDFVFSDSITFAVSGADASGTGVSNNSGGLRIERGTAQLDFQAIPEPASAALIAGTALLVAGRRRSRFTAR